VQGVRSLNRVGELRRQLKRPCIANDGLNHTGPPHIHKPSSVSWEREGPDGREVVAQCLPTIGRSRSGPNKIASG
jgi:hypothetical protein